MPPTSTTHRDPRTALLWARGLTAAGDQAWEMALPLAVAALYPRNVQLVAGIWLVLRIAQAIFVQRVAAMIDRWPPLRVLRVGIFGQTLGVAATWTILAAMVSVRANGDERWLWPLLALAQTTTALSAALMDVAVAQSWLPRLVPTAALPRTNVRLRQLDLGAEVLMPVAAGALLAAVDAPLSGLGIIAALNFASFVPEFLLMRGLIRALPTPQVASTAADFDLASRWRLFRAQPIFGALLAYACLWSTVLTPHGAVLTAWLSGVGDLDERAIGLFRGLGAFAGVLGAQLHQLVRRRYPLVVTARAFVFLQAVAIVGATASLGGGWLPGFLLGVVLSRTGLFGFAVGEVEIRQRGVAESVRGRVSGLAASANQASTVFVLLLATTLPGEDNLFPLAIVSAVAVVVGASLFWRWSMTPAARDLDAGRGQGEPGAPASASPVSPTSPG